MTRRALMLAGAALLVAPAAALATFGLMTVQRWNAEGHRARGERVQLNGRDITNDCFCFNDREGWADVFLRNADGRCFLREDRSAAASQRLFGRVTVSS